LAKHPLSMCENSKQLTRAPDAEYVASIISAWALRIVDASSGNTRPKVTRGEVSISERDQKFMLDVYSDLHQWIADEPTDVGGANAGPDPYEHLLASVGTCTAMTLRMYAGRKQWPLENAEVTLRHTREHQSDCEGCENTPLKLDVIERDIALHGNLTENQRESLMAIADKCPVHRTLTGNLDIRTRQT